MCGMIVSWRLDREIRLSRHKSISRDKLEQSFLPIRRPLNFLHLGSIMGCPGGTRSVFTHYFWAKRELQCIFLAKKAITITFKHGMTILFSRGNLFLGKLKEKLAWKACVNTDASISDSAHAPWASHNTPYIQLIQYGRRIGKKVYSSYFQALMYWYQ